MCRTDEGRRTEQFNLAVMTAERINYRIRQDTAKRIIKMLGKESQFQKEQRSTTEAAVLNKCIRNIKEEFNLEGE